MNTDDFARVKATFIRRTSELSMSFDTSGGQKRFTSQETDGGKPNARPNARQDDDVLLLALEAIDGVEIYDASNAGSKALLERSPQFPDLRPVHRHDADFEVEVVARELLAEPVEQRDSDLGLCPVDQRVEPALLFYAFGNVVEAIGTELRGGVPRLLRLRCHVWSVQ